MTLRPGMIDTVAALGAGILGRMHFRKPWILVLVVLMTAVAACSRSGPNHNSAETTVSIEPGDVTVESAGAPVELPDADRKAILDGVRAYVEDGVVATLRDGQPKAMKSVFDAAALAQVKGGDTAVLFDDGAPPAKGDITATTKPVTITALADATGTIVLVTAKLNLTVTAGTEDGDLTTQRVGELTFAPSADGWKITAFDLSVRRTGAGVTTKKKNSTTESTAVSTSPTSAPPTQKSTP